MALKDILQIKSSTEKLGISEERVNAIIPIGR